MLEFNYLENPMTINIGDTLPKVTSFILAENGGPLAINSENLFLGKTVVLFGIVGAYTETCSTSHLPGFLKHSDTLKKKGADDIICLSVNDAFVMAAWSKDHNVRKRIQMVSDGNALFVKKLGLELDLTNFGLGIRSQRFSMVIEDCIVKNLQRENPPTADLPAANLTSAEHLLKVWQ